MGKSQKQTVGHKYHLGGHQVLCQGPIDRISAIRVKDLIAWQGNTTGGQIQIDAEHLFGGSSEPARTSLFSQTVGGDNEDANGVSGTVDILMGERTQTKNSYLQKVLGNLIPAFRGVVSAVLRQCYIGNSEYPDAWSFLGTRIHTKEWGEEQWYDEKAEIVGAGVLTVTEQINFNALGDGVNGSYRYQGITVLADPSETLKVKKLTTAEGGLYQAWRIGAGSFSWSSTVYVRKGAGGPISTYWSGSYSTATAAENAAVAAGTITLTGYSEYTFCVYDDRYADNQGGLSLKVERVRQLTDMNPAHWLRELYTSKRNAMGHPEVDINDVALMEVADKLYDEGVGISLLWDQQKSVDEMFDLTLDHIEGVHYVNDEGLLTVKLIRDDYDIDDLMVIDNSIVIRVEKYSSTNQLELVNAITGVYDDTASRKEASVMVADPALVQTQGKIKSATIQLPFFSNAKTTIRRITGELRKKSNSLMAFELVCNRKVAYLNIGDVFILNLPSHNAFNIVMRIFDKKKGNGLNNEVRLVCTQDVYSLPQQAIKVVTPDTWVDPRSPASPVPAQLTFELPYYELVQAQGQTEVDNALSDPTVGALGVAAVRPSGSAVNAQIMVDTGAGYRGADELEFCPTALLATAMNYTTKNITFTDDIDVDLVAVGSHCQIDDELCVIEALDFTARTATLGRGVLDTIPAKQHLVGTRIWFWDFYSASDTQTYIDGQSVNVKVLPNTSSGRLPIASALAKSFTFDSRAARPYPPGNFKVNGVAFGSSVASNADIEFSWAHRDKVLQTAGTLQPHTYGDIGPEPGTTYNLRIYNQFNTLIRTQSGSGNSYLYTTTQEQIDNGGGGGSSQVVDPLWSKTSLLLNFNGTNGSTIFTDSSGNYLTPSGDVKTVTTTYKFAGSSVYFDGTGDYLSFSHDAFGSGDFTLEAWIYLPSLPGAGATIYDSRNSNTATAGFQFYVRSTGILSFYTGSTASPGVTVMSTNTWHHVALTRSGTTIRGFLNGVQEFSLTNSANLSLTSVRVGSSWDSASYFLGNMNDMRITKAAARYTSGFTPPAKQLGKFVKSSDWSDNILALIFEGDNNSTNIVDRSDLGKTISVFGNARLSTAQAKFGGSSLYLERSISYADFIWAPFDINYSGVSNFTVECWVRPIDPADGTSYKAIASTGLPPASDKAGWRLLLDTSGNLTLAGFNTGVATFFINGSTPLTANTWAHVAFVKNGTSWKLFLNGVSQGTATESGAIGPGDYLCIGRDQNIGSAGDWYGYIDEFRVRTGAKYSADFTPPASSFLPQDSNWSNVIVLANFNGVNNAADFENIAELQKTATVTGDAKISTAQFKYGSSAGVFDGTGDYITMPHNTMHSASLGNFTIEAWVYPTAIGSIRTIASKRPDGGSTEWTFNMTATGAVGFTAWSSAGSAVVTLSSTTALTVNTWSHVAVTQVGTLWTVWINGVAQGTATRSGTIGTNTTGVKIGREHLANPREWLGYISDVRITQSGRYTADFAVPSKQLSKFVPALNSQLRIELESVRDGLTSMQKYNHIISRAA